MNVTSTSLLENLCRTCMGEGDNESKMNNKICKTISIFNESECMERKNVTIMELLMLTTPQLTIETSDMLPKILCENCLKRLINAHEFQQMCIRVEQKFRQMIKDQKPVNSLIITDPLNDNVVTQAINDLTNILKIEMDEPLIDHDVSTFVDKSIGDDNEEFKFETENNYWDDSSDEFVEEDDSGQDSEWESQCTVIKKKRSPRNSTKLEDNTENSNNQNNPEKLYNLVATVSEKDKESKKCLTTLKSPEGSINFVCDECGNRLKTRKSLKRHKRIHLKPSGGQKCSQTKTKYECEFCKKVFQQSSSLKDHLRIHTGEQPYLCSECGKAFKSLSNMKQHFLRHGTDRPYACPDCPKRFPCLSDLASHKAVHNKTKSHVCDICGAGFVKPYLLKKHKMYHTGEKNHKCDYCDMRFVLADQCRRHMRTHTGEKPYKCRYCERAFAQSNDLIKHLRGHLGDNVYKCDLCPKGFRLQGDLRSHFNTHKNDDEETRLRNLQALKNEEQRLQMKFGLAKCT